MQRKAGRSAEESSAAIAELRHMIEQQSELLRSLSEQVGRAVSRYDELLEQLVKAREPASRAGDQAEAGPPASSAHDGSQPAEPSSPAARHAAYRRLVLRVREMVAGTIPPGATVIVVSKGDEELLKLEGRKGWHFPQREDGQYAGYHPADSAAAIAQLEELRARGGEYLLLPSTAFWWLEHYAGLRQHLESNYRMATREEDTCAIYVLREPEVQRRQRTDGLEDLIQQQLARQVREVVDSILPPDSVVLVASNGDEELPDLGGRRAWRFGRREEGEAARHRPADNAGLITRLERLRAGGGEYLVVPKTLFGWLEREEDLKAHLEINYRVVTRQRHVCLIFALADNQL